MAFSLDSHWLLTHEDGHTENIVMPAHHMYDMPCGPQFGHTVVFSQIIHSDEDRKECVTMGADWFWKAELNGVVILDNMAGNGYVVAYDNHELHLPLKAGDNELKVTVSSGSNGWSLGTAALGTKDAGLPLRTYVFTPNPAEKRGVLKMLGGGNLAPELHNGSLYPDYNRQYGEMMIPMTRLHDCPLNNPGERLVDIPQIFANPKADPDDPDNYYFIQTDEYIKNCLDLGTKIYYRLGNSIEHTVNHYFTNPNMSAEKWAHVCSNVIRHYNEGWGNGFHFGIEYWEIWNEPVLADDVNNPVGNPKQWYGTRDEFYAFYAEAATILKRNFPQLKIGGPGDTGPSCAPCFLKYMGEHHVPLDFYSYHTYPYDYRCCLRNPGIVRKLLDDNGYTNTEIHVNEWHYCLGMSAKCRPGDRYGFKEQMERHSIIAASFAMGCMIGWQDTPLDMAFYYTVTLSPYWGVFYGGDREPTTAYHALRLMNTLYKSTPNRVGIQGTGEMTDFCKTLAGVSDDGKTFMMIVSNFKQPCEVTVDLRNLKGYSLEVTQLTDDNTAQEFTPVTGEAIQLNAAESSIWLIKGTML